MKTISFHSYKGGTGKSLISLNISAKLAQEGYSVILLDYDFLGPSLYGVLGEKKTYLNDAIYGNIDILNVIHEYTSEKLTNGRLYYGVANPEPAEINKIHQLGNTGIRQSFERTMDVKEVLEEELKADYIIVDTGPGLRLDSANAIVVSDHVSLVLKPTKIDVLGTIKLVQSMKEAYASNKKLGIILNRGLDTNWQSEATLPIAENDYSHLISYLENFTSENSIPIEATLPCICDIARSLSDRILILDYPDHIFCKNISDLSKIYTK